MRRIADAITGIYGREEAVELFLFPPPIDRWVVEVGKEKRFGLKDVEERLEGLVGFLFLPPLLAIKVEGFADGK